MVSQSRIRGSWGPGVPALLALVLGCAWPAPAVAGEVTGDHIRQLGLEARLDADLRDGHLLEIAHLMRSLGSGAVRGLQGDFQYALLLSADPAIYDTLRPETIAAIDSGLEGLFSLEDIDRDNRWEPLIYAYGFFNRDVTAETVQRVLGYWSALPETDKVPRYPTYIHVIDAVSKPVSMGAVGDRENTRAILERVLPAMKRQFLQPPRPGTAFHPPSHACLVLGPLYDRWVDDPDFGALVVEHLGTRAEFEAMLASQLPGGLPEGPPASHMALGYYTYIGGYLANTLARLDARSALPALRRSLAIYEGQNGPGRTPEYTRRALLALGDPESRESFARRCENPEYREACIALAVWLARNGKNETKSYGEAVLGILLNCPPDLALETWFRQEKAALRP